MKIHHPNRFQPSLKKQLLLIGGIDALGGAGLATDLHFAENLKLARPVMIPTFLSLQARPNPLDRQIKRNQKNKQNQQNQKVSNFFQLQATAPRLFRSLLEEIAQKFQSKKGTRLIVKIGALANPQQLSIILELLGPLPQRPFFILDPVLNSSLGHQFLSPKKILPYLKHIDLLTPNLAEAEQLAELSIKNKNDINLFAQKLLSTGLKNLLIKGGHRDGEDFFANDLSSLWLSSRYFPKVSMRGTGCALATLIAQALVDNCELKDAIVWAKFQLTQYLSPLPASQHKPSFYFPRVSFHTPRKTWSRKFPKLTHLVEKVDPGPKLYPIVDSFKNLKKIISSASTLDRKDNQHPIACLQLRIKGEDKLSASLEREISQAIEYARLHGIPLLINDYWELALKLKADGVHLGFEDLQQADLIRIHRAGLALGVSSHTYAEAAYALQFNPSYLALGPIYKTQLKKMPFLPQGAQTLSTWKMISHVPICAIGGITLENADPIFEQRPALISMVRDLQNAQRPIGRIKAWQKKIISVR